MDRRYRKPHRYKKRKPIFRKKFVAFGLLAVVAVGAVFYGLFLWKILWVEEIVISGQEKIAKEEIESLVSKRLENKVLFFTTKSILVVDGGQIREDILNTFPEISEVEVGKNFFNTISVQIIERKALALWCENDSCFLLDEHGVIFEEAPSDSGLIIIKTNQSPNEFIIGETVLSSEKIDKILAIKSKLAETLQVSITTAEVFDERLDVEITEGWTIRFNLKGDLDWQVTELKLALEKQISPEKRKSLEYIDLRFSRVYYK